MDFGDFDDLDHNKLTWWEGIIERLTVSAERVVRAIEHAVDVYDQRLSFEQERNVTIRREQEARAEAKGARRHYLQEWRNARGMSQEELAHRANCSVESIEKWEAGIRGISPEYQFRVMAALKIEPYQFFEPPLTGENEEGAE